MRDRTKGKTALEWIHVVTKHVKRSMGSVLRDDVMQGITRVAGR
jgi:hypothetical protein